MSDVKAVTAAEVREWFNAHPKSVPEGDKSVGKESKGRGRISPAALKVYFNSHKDAEYAKSTVKASAKTVDLVVPMTDKAGRKRPDLHVTLPLSEVRTLAGQPTDTRGRVSADTLAKAAEAYAVQKRAENAGKAKTRKPNSKPAETNVEAVETVSEATPEVAETEAVAV